MVAKNTLLKKGTLSKKNFYSNALKKNWDYSVYFPFGYGESKQKYPVMYMLHGLTDDHQSWIQKGNIHNILDEYIEKKEFPPCVVIFPDGQNAWYSNIPHLSMRDAFVNDLFPHVESSYSLINDKKARSIGGLSMGGHGSLVFSLSYPDYFSSAFILSPAITKYGKRPSDGVIHFMRDENLDYVYGSPFSQSKWDEYSYHDAYKSYLASNETVNFFVGTGIDDTITPIENARDLVSDFTRDSIPHIYSEVPGEHEWAVWMKLMKNVLPFVKNNFL